MKKKKKITLNTHKENINTLSKLLNIMFYSPKQHTDQGFPQHFFFIGSDNWFYSISERTK